MKNGPLKTMSFNMALEIIALCETLNSNNHYVLSKQLLRSGTAVGALIIEAQHGESPKDFIHKLYISRKECAETIYWLDLLLKTEHITVIEYDKLTNIASQVLKMLNSSILTVKQKI
jgi:four helix bundle protein